MSATTHGRRRDGGHDPMADGPRSLGRRARWALALRLARREVRRHPWRHALVVAMVFVPVLAAFGTLSFLHSSQVTSDRAAAFETAGSDASIRVAIDGRTTEPGTSIAEALAGARAQVPRGAQAEERWATGDWLVTDQARSDGRGPRLIGLALMSAVEGSRGAARYVVADGRLARTASEVLLSPAVAEAGGWTVGDEVESARTAQRFTVVGIGAPGDRVDAFEAVLGPVPDDFWLDAPRHVSGVETPTGTGVSTEPSLDLLVYGSPEARASTPEGRFDRSTEESTGITLAAAAICALVAVVASAAFAIASRRQLRSVGLLSVAGADPALVRATLVLQGAIPGLVAGLLAVGVGVVAIAVANRRDTALRLWDVSGAELLVSVPGALVAVALAVGAGTLAAWQPARTASRIPVLSALAGRRPLPPVRTRLPLGGLALLVAGAVALAATTRLGAERRSSDDLLAGSLPLLAIGGVAAIALGTVGLAPALVAGLGRVAGRTHGTTRLTLRSLSRHRTQSAATVAAVAVALSLPVGLLTNRAAEREQYAIDHAPPSGVVDAEPRAERLLFEPESLVAQVGGDRDSAEGRATQAAIHRTLGPRAATIVVTPFVDDLGNWIDVAAVPPEAVDALAPWARRRLATGHGISLRDRAGPQELRAGDGRVAVEAELPPGGRDTYVAGIDAALVVSTATLGDLGAGRPSSAELSVRPGPATAAELDALQALVDRADGLRDDLTPTLAEVRRTDAAPREEGSVWLSVPTLEPRGDLSQDAETGDHQRDEELFNLAAIATGLALLVLTITLSLRGVDTQDDLRAAVAIGAPPARLRHLRSLEGVVLAGLGALLALPVGWLPVIGFRAGQVRQGLRDPGTVAAVVDRIHVPGWEVLPILAVPVALAGLAWLVVPALAAALRPHQRDVLLPRS